MEIDYVEIFQAEVWKIIPVRILKIAWSQFGNLNWENRIDAKKFEVSNVALSYWILKNYSKKFKAGNVAIENRIQKVKWKAK